MTYNLVDGKVVKTKLDKENIFEEKANNYPYMKVCLPTGQGGICTRIIIYNCFGFSL